MECRNPEIKFETLFISVKVLKYIAVLIWKVNLKFSQRSQNEYNFNTY